MAQLTNMTIIRMNTDISTQVYQTRLLICARTTNLFFYGFISRIVSMLTELVESFQYRLNRRPLVYETKTMQLLIKLMYCKRSWMGHHLMGSLPLLTIDHISTF